MAQGALPFQYQVEQRPGGMTALAGLPAFLDLAYVVGLRTAIEQHLEVRGNGQGWTDAQMVMALILLNLAGGDCVEDLNGLEQDEGLCHVLRRTEFFKLPRQQLREMERRWRKERTRTVPSPTAARAYLAEFHNAEEETKREKGQAFIPAPNGNLLGLGQVNRELIAFIQSRNPQREATLDQDATLVETHKQQALYGYKGYAAYQPLNTWWTEQGVVLHSEFRDGNVPAGHEQRRVLEEALRILPAGVKKVYLRSDTAGYQWDVLRYCAEGKNERFGVIEFAIGADVTREFKRAVAQVAESEWRPLVRQVEGQRIETRQQWAEVCYVPNEAARRKDGPTYRFLAIREPLEQPELPGPEQAQLPFPTMSFGQERHKLFAVVTNRELPGDEVIWWHRGRCGKSEEAHSVMKEDLAGGKLPSGLFGANAAWWQIMVLALNLAAALKRLALGGSWVTKRLKALRYGLINLPGRVLMHAHRLVVRLSAGHTGAELLMALRSRILALAAPATG